MDESIRNKIIEALHEIAEPKLKVGDRIEHILYGKGTILGNYHQRQTGGWYWHVGYDNGTFGYNKESSMEKI